RSGASRRTPGRVPLRSGPPAGGLPRGIQRRSRREWIGEGSMSTIPFRLAPREASREELLRATVHPCSSTGFSPPAAFEPVGVILSKIRIGAYPDLQILCRAMAHPDERVPLTLVEWLSDGNARNLSPEVCDYIRIAALARGLADADREGITWGPLLDQLAASGHWPTQAA